MNLVKAVLIFQAIATIIIGLVFFSQAIAISSEKVSQTNINSIDNPIEGFSLSYHDFAKRFEAGAYIILVVAFIELLILYRI
jgi:hypothetical protein